MIDIHCHIVFGFDDGPENLEASLEMIEMAYRDGIRTIVATSHRNHVLDFKASETYDSSFKKLVEASREKYPELEIVRGAELYIGENYLEVLESKPYDFTLNSTDYVLVEFPREVKSSHILNVVHEFKVRGYKPVIAHIEMYPNLLEDEVSIKALRAEGAYLQITGSSLLGKQGREMMTKLRKFVKEGSIDFIASDGHSAIRRRPVLSKAYDLVVKDCSLEVADALFRVNPEKLIAGETVERFAFKSGKKKKMSRVSLNLAGSVAAVLLVAVLGAFTLGSRGEAPTVANSDYSESALEAEENGEELAEQNSPLAFISRIFDFGGDDKAEKLAELKAEEKLIVAAEEDEKLEATKKLEEAQKSEADDEKASENQQLESTSLGSQESAETSNTVSRPSKSKAEIESRYKSKLNGLSSQYQGAVSSAVSNIKSAGSIADPQERASAVEGYIDQVSGMESSADNSVYGLLYEMQNELEANGHDTSSVEVFRSEYQQQKESAKSQYLK